jgi:hypothetical protein
MTTSREMENEDVASLTGGKTAGLPDKWIVTDPVKKGTYPLIPF